MKDWIKTKGIRQYECARALGVSPGFLSVILSGAKRPSLELAMRINLFTGGQVPMTAWFSDDDIKKMKKLFPAPDGEPGAGDVREAV